MQVPRLLIISDAGVASESVGASKTLYELFSSYPGPIRVITISREPTDHLDRVRVPHRILPGRLDELNPAAMAATRRAEAWLLGHGPWLRSAVRAFRPQIILACPIGEWGVAAAAAATRIAQVPLISYFMDDWVGAESSASAAPELLQRSTAWLMISEQLRDVLVERYGLVAPPTKTVHKPARATSEPRRDRAATGSGGPCRIIYAGSIWPMHADAIALAADAVGLLRARGQDFELVVHAPERFVRDHPALFEKDGVIEGGLCDSAELQQVLLEADLALLACAFAEDQRLMSRSSVQTKLTEYMSTGIPILGVGPADAASIEFVKRWNVGRCCTLPDVARLADTLAEFASSDELAEIAARSRDIVRQHFDADRIRAQLWQFIASAADTSDPSRIPRDGNRSDGFS